MARFLRKTINFLSGPYLVFWIMPYFMVLLVLGTIEQKYIGLHDAVQTYIYDLIIWWNFLPLPGGGLVLAILFLSLLCNFLFASEWSFKKSGILLSHFGILLLLVGGAITYITNEEGYMILAEGEQSNIFYDYRQRVIDIQANEQSQQIDFATLTNDKIIDIKGSNKKIKILSVCKNCDVVPAPDDSNRKGLAQDIALKSIPSNINKEENAAGATMEIFDQNMNSLGIYISLENLNDPAKIDNIEINIQRAEKKLPFYIKLADFRKVDYQASSRAQNYQSDIFIHAGIKPWLYTIEMNKPLRYGGYVFYQSSFDQNNDKEISVLSIVKNKGKLFPYISSLIIALGLLIHCIIRMREKS